MLATVGVSDRSAAVAGKSTAAFLVAHKCSADEVGKEPDVAADASLFYAVAV